MRTFLVAMLVICLPLMVAASDLASPERCLAREASASGEAPTLVTGDWDLIPRGGRYCDDDTLWIFDADFNTTTGDDAGWLSEDLSGTLGQPNHWHKDTIRIAGFEHLGDSTWWCGAYDECWAQPRGYGNDWVQYLERDFPLSQWSAPGDEVSLEWDQRFAIEGDYDYGYVDISDDGGTSWTTLASYSNMNFAGQPGWPRPWDHPELGHPVHSLDAYAGQDVRVRFRFESDIVYSSQDEPDNVHHSVLDGAWQLDNIEWTVNETSVWLDDCESPGDNGWVHEDLEPVGQTGVVYSRVYDPDMLWSQCVWHTNHWWMMAVDPVSGRMVDDQDCRLLSPPIDVGDSEVMIIEWTALVDMRNESNDFATLELWTGTNESCVGDYNIVDPDTLLGPFYGGPFESEWAHRVNLPAEHHLVALDWRVWNDEPVGNPELHMVGFALDRVRVGLPTTLTPTEIRTSVWYWFYDTFELTEALAETARISITDADGIASAYFVASNDLGATWHALQLTPPANPDDDWIVPAPASLIGPATEIWCYIEVTDGTGAVNTKPRSAPDVVYEFSVLPIKGSLEEPCILLVDKYGRAIAGEDRQYRWESEYYYRESLDVLGYEYDVFDVRVPSGTIYADGPDLEYMYYYDTQLWCTGEFTWGSVLRSDQANLIDWLSDAAEGAERNLLLSGSDIGLSLVGLGEDTLDFYGGWLASEYVQDQPSVNDSMPRLRDASGDFDFMTHGDGLCYLWDHW